MRIYVAGKWDDKVPIQQVMGYLVSMGHTITHDWTRFEVGTNPHINIFDSRPHHLQHLSISAQLDIDGVRHADLVLVLMTDSKYAYRGSFSELGCALGLGKPIVMVCPDPNAYCRSNCFFHHPSIIHFNDVDSALKYIVSLR